MYKFNTTPHRSALMKKIKSTNTMPETLLSKLLWARGIRYRKNYKKLVGNPDIAITTKKIAIFIDGEFWHGYNWEEKKPKIKDNRDYWIPKIERTIKRDKETNEKLKELGWTVLRFWEKEITNNIDEIVNKIILMY